MTDIDRRTLLGAAAAGLVAGTTPVVAGSLTPPGVPSPTGVTLGALDAAVAAVDAAVGTVETKVDTANARILVAEPRRPLNPADAYAVGSALFALNQGSYYLTGNLSVPAGMVAFSIFQNVVLDLCGFEIQLQAGATGAVSMVGNPNGGPVTIRNGTIFTFSNDAATTVLDLSLARSAVVEDVQISATASAGILILRRGVVRRCHVTRANVGINSGELSLISDCQVADGAAGIKGGPGSRVERCTVANTTVAGIDVEGGTVSDCVVRNSSSVGIVARGSSVVRDSLVDGAWYGVYLDTYGRNTVRGNRINNCGQAPYSPGAAIRVNTGVANQIDGNQIANAAVGVEIADFYTLVVRNSFAFCANPVSETGGTLNTIGPVANLRDGADPALGTDAAHPLANIWI